MYQWFMLMTARFFFSDFFLFLWFCLLLILYGGNKVWPELLGWWKGKESKYFNLLQREMSIFVKQLYRWHCWGCLVVSMNTWCFYKKNYSSRKYSLPSFLNLWKLDDLDDDVDSSCSLFLMHLFFPLLRPQCTKRKLQVEGALAILGL